ncbi:MAG TPA: GerAB/ArcD/ProY family transporter [Desulfobacteria bacterium]|nr:GerAB/ArcD/ProY family transporter [Desulfobacteria bacterium]
MVKQGHIGTTELLALLIIYQSILMFYNLPTALAIRATTGAWLLNILVCAASISFYLPIHLLIKRFNYAPLPEIAYAVLGKAGGIGVTLVVSGFFLYLFTMFLKLFAGAIGVTILPNTPVSVIILISIIGIIAVSFYGMEGVTRTALIFLPFVVLGFILTIILSVPELDSAGMFPLLGVPVQDHLSHAGLLGLVVHETLSLSVVAPYVRKGKSLSKLCVWTLVIVAVVSTILVLLCQLQFIYPGLKEIPYPLYQLVRMIYVGRFIQRLDAVFVLLAIVSSTIQMSFIFQITMLSLAQGLRLDDWRPLIMPVAIIAYALTFLFFSPESITTWYYSIGNSVLTACVTLTVPLLIFFVSLARGKRGRNLAQNTT